MRHHATEASNLWVWEMTNEVTNVNGGCVGWWKIADTSNSTTIADSSGNGWTGNCVSSPVWTNGLNSVVSQALNFNGSDSTVNIPINTSFITGPFITVSLWLKFTGTLTGSFVAAYANIDSFYDGSSGNAQAFQAFSDDCACVRGAIIDISGNTAETGNPHMADGKWHHFVFATDMTNIYDWFDGIRDLGSLMDFGTGSTPTGDEQITNWWKGLTNVQLSAINFYTNSLQPCTMTDIRIYNRVLNDAEVDILYRAPTVDEIVGAYNY